VAKPEDKEAELRLRRYHEHMDTAIGGIESVGFTEWAMLLGEICSDNTTETLAAGAKLRSIVLEFCKAHKISPPWGIDQDAALGAVAGALLSWQDPGGEKPTVIPPADKETA
jgi:hypothetical protein